MNRDHVCDCENRNNGGEESFPSTFWVNLKFVHNNRCNLDILLICVCVCLCQGKCVSHLFLSDWWPLTLTATSAPCNNCPFEAPRPLWPLGLCACVCVSSWRPVTAVWSWAELTGLKEPGLRGEESPSLSLGDQKWHSASADALRAADA